MEKYYGEERTEEQLRLINMLSNLKNEIEKEGYFYSHM